MNSLLADTLGFLNSFIAVAILVIGSRLGFVFGVFILPPGWPAALAGCGIALIVAALICGYLAIMIDIRRQLIRLVGIHTLAALVNKRIEPTL